MLQIGCARDLLACLGLLGIIVATSGFKCGFIVLAVLVLLQQNHSNAVIAQLLWRCGHVIVEQPLSESMMDSFVASIQFFQLLLFHMP